MLETLARGKICIQPFLKATNAHGILRGEGDCTENGAKSHLPRGRGSSSGAARSLWNPHRRKSPGTSFDSRTSSRTLRALSLPARPSNSRMSRLAHPCRRNAESTAMFSISHSRPRQRATTKPAIRQLVRRRFRCRFHHQADAPRRAALVAALARGTRRDIPAHSSERRSATRRSIAISRGMSLNSAGRTRMRLLRRPPGLGRE